MNVSVIRADAERLDELTTLFDGYRTSYGQDGDSTAARRFLEERFERQDSVLFMAIDESTDRGVAFAQLYPSFSSVAMKRVWILNDLFVDLSARRCGIGRQLMDTVAAFAASTNAARVDLATARDNLAAKQLYESVGFNEDTVFDHYKLPVG